MGVGSHRVMGVGLPLLQTLTQTELKAIVAHEFGHYASGGAKIGPWIQRRAPRSAARSRACTAAGSRRRSNGTAISSCV